MGGGRTDAAISRDRCLQAIVGADFETARSLWRAALRYNGRCRREAAGLEFSTPLAGFAVGSGEL